MVEQFLRLRDPDPEWFEAGIKFSSSRYSALVYFDPWDENRCVFDETTRREIDRISLTDIIIATTALKPLKFS